MTEIILGTPSPVEEDEKAPLDIKQPSHQPVVTPPTLTPALTPEEQLPEDIDDMAGKKVFTLERPDDRARELAAKLTLEEQVGLTHIPDILLNLLVYPSIHQNHVLRCICPWSQFVSFPILFLFLEWSCIWAHLDWRGFPFSPKETSPLICCDPYNECSFGCFNHYSPTDSDSVIGCNADLADFAFGGRRLLEDNANS